MKDELLNELKLLAESFLLLLVLLIIIFPHSPIAVTLRALLAVYWILILPGFAVSHIIRIKSFVERIAVSVAISAGLIGVSAYYLGLAGFNVNYTVIALPLVVILGSGVMMLRELRKKVA